MALQTSACSVVSETVTCYFLISVLLSVTVALEAVSCYFFINAIVGITVAREAKWLVNEIQENSRHPLVQGEASDGP
jgi:hypothetical protein